MKKWLTILLLMSIGFVTAQPPVFSFRNTGINDGLSQNSVVDIAIDQTGFLWLATQDGLNRFDGKDFLVFSKIFDDATVPSGNRLGKVITGNNNDLWMISSGGKVERLNLYNHQFETLSKLGRDSIPLPPASSLYINKNNELWIGTENNGLFVYSLTNKSVKHFTAQPSSPLQLTNDHIQTIFADSKNDYWLLTKNGVTVINSSVTKAKKLLYSSNTSSLISYSDMDEDKDGSLWLGSFGKGLFIKRKDENNFTPFTGFSSSQSLPADLVVYAVKADRDDNIWIGTYSNGIYLINKKDRSIQNFKTDKRKPFSHGHNDVLCIKLDSKGGVWIGTDGGGLSYYNKSLNNFSTLSAENLPDSVSIDQVRSIVVDKYGMILAGTSEKGLFYTDPANAVSRQLLFPSYKKSISNPNRIVSLHCDEEGDIWLGTQANGLIILEAKSKKIKRWLHPDANGPPKIPDHTTWCMLPFEKNKIIAGTSANGLCVIDKYTGIIKSFKRNDSLPVSAGINNIRAVAKMNDSIYIIGYERRGIQLLNIKTGIFEAINNGPLNAIWKEETILKCVFYKFPFIFIGTQGKGIIIYNLSTEKVFRLTEEEGLPNNTIYSIVEDRQGNLWSSSNKGLCRFRLPKDISSINPTYFNLYSVQDGLQSNEFNTGAWYVADNGMLYFGGIKGLNYFNPVNFISASQQIPVVITQVNIKNIPFISDTVISYKQNLQLKYHENSVSFNYAGLNFFSSSGLQYMYRLSGYDDDWINAGNRSYAAYTNLSPGDYTFEVKAYNQNNNESGPVTRLAIQIRPPFWQTWWFIVSAVLLFISLLYAFYRYRVNQILQMQNVRSRIAADLHDEIGSTLTNINILTELSKKNIDRKREAEVFLSRISEEASISGQALDDIVWSINKDNDSIEQTVARMRRYAAEVFEACQVSYSLTADEQINGKKLDMELRRDFFMLFKETVNNICKHSKATNAEIRIGIEKKNLLLHISDNGNGFDTAAPTHRNGIKGIYTRTKKWKGHAHIQSGPGKGTSVHISLPLS